MWDGIAQSVKRLATDWTFRGSNPGGGRPDRPCGLPSLLYNGYQVFQGIKRPGRGADHPPPSKCRGQERVGLYLYSPSGASWPVMGAPLPLYLYLYIYIYIYIYMFLELTAVLCHLTLCI